MIVSRHGVENYFYIFGGKDERSQDLIQGITLAGSKDYGALSLAVQYYSRPEIITHVPPTCFIPRPNVGSTVIRLTRYEKPPVEAADESFLFSLIRASFNQRRKTLVNGLGNASGLNLSKAQITEALEQMGLPANVRGETFTLEQFARLSELLYRKK